jgi:hypothetical protein
MNARFQKIYNDLFWEVFDSKQQKYIKWQGYNDSYWWDNVAISDQFQIRGEYRLDPFTNTVSILTKYAPDVAPVTSAEPLSGLESVPAVESDTQPRG